MPDDESLHENTIADLVGKATAFRDELAEMRRDIDTNHDEIVVNEEAIRDLRNEFEELRSTVDDLESRLEGHL